MKSLPRRYSEDHNENLAFVAGFQEATKALNFERDNAIWSRDGFKRDVVRLGNKVHDMCMSTNAIADELRMLAKSIRKQDYFEERADLLDALALRLERSASGPNP